MKLLNYSMLFVSLSLGQNASASVWGSIKNAFNDCRYTNEERAEITQLEMMITPKLPEHFAGVFSEEMFTKQPWMRDFRYVIVVNKGTKGNLAQTMRVYETGRLIHQAKVSTGREGFELKRKNPVCSGAPPKSYWSQTPTGFYTPKFLSKDHVSSSWDSDMPYAIFYDIDNGLALHQVYFKYESLLGNRASGGCTRQDPETAAELFKRVQETTGYTIPEVREDGTPVRNGDGSIRYINEQFWTNKKTGQVVKYPTYSALIIIENRDNERESLFTRSSW
ncbi:MAG: L,D-transpeptidase [Bdellovibrionia bacterium]